jgi:hypothetical protein
MIRIYVPALKYIHVFASAAWLVKRGFENTAASVASIVTKSTCEL